MNSIRLALVEDDPEVRELLCGYLCRQPELSCGRVVDFAEAFLRELPDVAAPRRWCGPTFTCPA